MLVKNDVKVEKPIEKACAYVEARGNSVYEEWESGANVAKDQNLLPKHSKVSIALFRFSPLDSTWTGIGQLESMMR